MIPALDTYLDTLGLSWLSSLLNIVLAFVLAGILTRTTGRVVRHAAKRRASRVTKDDIVARRIETGTSIFEGIAKYVFYFIAVAISIGELGLTSAMTSMLAAAGIGTLALGIGAQSLIRDITAGFFILFEDILAVGDYVLIAGIEGIVEEVSLRTVTVRGFRGDKNIIPNGTIGTITNYSRDDYLAVVDMSISLESDADRALEILYQEAQAVYEEMKDDGVQPPSRVGILQVTESSVTLRVTMKANVMQQWTITRETIRRTRLRYEAEGIRTPHNTVLLREEKQ
ncbi:MAG: mechanosensitive ion channel family protein [Clostridia bacterium]|nr:mechanosensitive ion channel family protein [Candidatus Pelethousia sp.]NCB31519.1 mechanosensitive ion channel family protein [Clostridia bacterium]